MNARPSQLVSDADYLNGLAKKWEAAAATAAAAAAAAAAASADDDDDDGGGDGDDDDAPGTTSAEDTDGSVMTVSPLASAAGPLTQMQLSLGSCVSSSSTTQRKLLLRL